MGCQQLMPVFCILLFVTPGEFTQKCGRPCPSPPAIDPGLTQVCASDGKTYNSVEALECEKLCNPDLEFFKHGECPKVGTCGGPCSVSKVYFPLCGTDGKTYQNLDYLKCQFLCDSKLKISHLGVCREVALQCGAPCKASKDLNPICGSDGIVYKNLDNFKCQKSCDPDLTIRHAGPCSKSKKKQACGDPCNANDAFQPICGTNLKTYKNMDFFKCQKLCDIDLEILHKGVCKELHHQCGDPCPTTQEFDPV